MSGPEQWDFIETSPGESLLEINAPLVTRIYHQNYGIVDRSNQEGSYYKLNRKTRRKQNRLLFDAIETYGLINTRTIFINSLEIVADLKKVNLQQGNSDFPLSEIGLQDAGCLLARQHYIIHLLQRSTLPICCPLFIQPGEVHIDHANSMQ